MSDAVTKPVAKKAKTPTKAKKAPKVASHPTYNAMIVSAIETLKDRKGSSRQAVHKYVVANYKVEAKSATTHLRQALKRAVASGKLVQVKGSYKLGKTEEKPKKKGVKKPVASKSPKKVAAKKPVAKTVKKSAAATKKPKVAPKKSSTATTKPTTATKKPVAVTKKSPVKSKAAKKTPVKKPVAKKSAKKTAAKK